MGFIKNIAEGFSLRFKETPQLTAGPYAYAYDSIGYLPFTVAPNSGGDGFGGLFFQQIGLTSPGTYQNTHTVLVGQPPIFDGVVNQPLGYPGELG